MATLFAENRQVTPVTLATHFPADVIVDGTRTVQQYLGTLAANATTVNNAREYAQTIFDLAVRRNLIQIGEDMVNAAYDAAVDFPPREQIVEAETRLFSLAETGKYGSGFVSFATAMDAAIEVSQEAARRGKVGISTGLTNLDALLGGLRPSRLYILAGRPSMGKTAVATNMAYRAALARHGSIAAKPELDRNDEGHDGAVVGFFSLEMSKEELAARIIADRVNVAADKIDRGTFSPEEHRRMLWTQRELKSLPLHIDDTGGLSIAQVAARARRLKREQGVGAIFVDYLQLMTGIRGSREGRVQEVTEITVGLKALAKELNVPIVALSQLSRAAENRGPRPNPTARLRPPSWLTTDRSLFICAKSGSIEQDADAVMFCYRDEYYVEQKLVAVAGAAEINVAKQRHGRIGRADLTFELEFLRFTDAARPSEAERATSNGRAIYSAYERAAR